MLEYTQDIIFRRWTTVFLVKIGPVAVPTLVEALKDVALYVRQTAVEVLEKINTPEALKALDKFRKKFK
jgi:HEAT repeat protein